MVNFNWVCPYCANSQTVTDENYSESQFRFKNNDKDDKQIGLISSAIKCLNFECSEVTINTRLHYFGEMTSYSQGESFYRIVRDPIRKWRLQPDSHAKFMPDYIPQALRDDYYEACQIRDLSPKAAATLARRCLQGMIRDFCGITRRTLIDEINELKAQVQNGTAPQGVAIESMDAIDAIRSIGNIGAHMEKDINFIVDVDPEEAQLLISMIENLFDDWYITRKKRQDRFSDIVSLSAAKKIEKQSASTAAPKPPTS